jgi:hypothetical protein
MRIPELLAISNSQTKESIYYSHKRPLHEWLLEWRSTVRVFGHIERIAKPKGFAKLASCRCQYIPLRAARCSASRV